MNRGLTVGRVRGIPIVIDPSWVVIALVVTWAIYSELLNTQRNEPAVVLWVITLVGAAAFFASVLGHELSHSLVAERRGLRVRRIRLFIFGGVSEIEQEAGSAQDELALTVAGPASSVILGAVLLAASFAVPSGWGAVERTVQLLGVVNIMLGLFNLLPGFPLDGGRILRALIWRKTGDFDQATRIAVAAGRAVALIIVGIGVLVIVLGDLAGLWYSAVGWFLFSAATAARTQHRFQQQVRGLTIADVMGAVPRVVPAEMSLEEFASGYLSVRRGAVFPVLADGRIRGLIGAADVRRVKRSDWPGVTVGRVMRSVVPADVVPGEAPVDAVLERLSGSGRRVLVTSDGRLAGMVGPRDLQRLVRRSAPDAN